MQSREPSAQSDDVRDVLAALVREVAALREELSAALPARRRRTLNASGAALLTAIAETWGTDREFLTAELVAFAGALETRRELRQAIGSATPRALGMRIRSIVGKPSKGLMLERIGGDRLGALWIVRAS